MKRILTIILLAATFSLHAAAPPRGDERLRELVVFPSMDFNFNWEISCQNNEWVISQTVDLPSAIAEQREKLKRQPDNAEQLLHLAYLLGSNGQTNESQACYQKAEQLCRNKVATNPQDGLSLMTLGVALDALGKKDEAEHDFREATLVSSNDWRCWIGLGNFLPGKYFSSMFPTNLLSRIVPGKIPYQAVWNYQPSAEALKKAEAARDEASRYFDRAMTIAPKEPEVFLQRAGYMYISNWQNCFFRHYRNNEEISTNEWLSTYISKETIANLQKASELKPKDYQYVSLAAYFEWFNARLQNKAVSFDPDTLPDAARQFIHDSMTHLENLSEDADKKTAAGALENLGILNMMFGNMPEATTDFRRAVALDPTRGQSWDLLFASLFGSASPDELAAVCESRLKYENSARNHIILSKILAQKMGKWKEASQHAQIAFQMETNNVIPPLMLAAIALKQGNEAEYLSAAKMNLEHAYALLQGAPSDKETPERWRELMLDGAIFDLYINQPHMASHLVNQVLKHFPDDSIATELLRNTVGD